MNRTDFAQVLQTSFGLILDAMPGITSIRFTRYKSGNEAIHVDTENENALAACAKLFGAKLEITGLDKEQSSGGEAVWWRRATKRYEELSIEMSGPHYRGDPPKYDHETIAAAAVKAGAAIAECDPQTAEVLP